MGVNGPLRWTLPAIAVLALLAPAADAKPSYCTKKGIVEALHAADKPTGAGVNAIICADVTADGTRDAVFTILSGGTAGPTHVGVISENPLFYRNGYKLTIDRVSNHRFDVQQPYYASDDANCCPSAFDVIPYRWNGTTFRRGKSTRYKHFQKRFH